jgi:hypothetical protein
MVRRVNAAFGWRPIAAALVALAIVTSPVMADQGKARGRKGKPAAHRYHQVKNQKDKHRGDRRHEYRRDDYRRHDHRGHDRHHSRWVKHPRYVERHVYHHYPRWSWKPYRVHYHDHHPFYYHSGFNVFFGSDNFAFEVGNFPPVGYGYYDPYCGDSFVSVSAYRRHLHRHHHPALIRVVVVDDDYACGPDYYHDGDYWYDD